MLSHLGQGGQAEVYLARHRELGTLHAVKLLTYRCPDTRARVLQEGRIQAGFRHPNIVGVRDLLRIDGAPALVMELVRGPSLHELLRVRGLSILQVDALARGIMDGVDSAHRRGLIHRDLKPQNILLEPRRDGSVRPRVMDFGLAKVLGEGRLALSQTGVAMGTPSYMAPEQFRDAKHVDERADVYALGAICYEMLTGTRAVQGRGMFEIYASLKRREYTPAARLRRGVLARMDEAMQRALAFDPRDRPSSVAEFRAIWTGDQPLGPVVWPSAELTRLGELGPPLPPESSPRPVEPPGDPSSRALVTAPLPLTQAVPPSAPEPPAAPTQRRPVGLWALGGLLALVSAAGLGWSLRGLDVLAEPAPRVVRSSPVEAPAPPPKRGQPTRAPVRTQINAPLPRPKVPAGALQRPKATAPLTKDTPPAPGTLWSLSGVPGGYAVSEDGRRFSPGEVPPGDYQVYAAFAEGRAIPVLSMRVVEGAQLGVDCEPSMRMCRLE